MALRNKIAQTIQNEKGFENVLWSKLILFFLLGFKAVV